MFVTRLGDLPAGDVLGVVNLLLSDFGRASVSADGLVVVGDKVEVLGRVAEAVAAIRKQVRSRWLVQLHILDVSASDVRSLGVEGQATLTASASSRGSGAVSGVADLALKSLRDASTSRVLSEPLCLVNEGLPYTFSSGESFSLVEQTTIPGVTGAITTGQKLQQAGFDLSITVRSLGDGNAVLTATVKDQVVIGTADRPRLRGYSLGSTLDVVSGETYLIGSAVRSEVGATSKWGLSFGSGSTAGRRVVQVYARVYRVGSLERSPLAESVAIAYP